MVNEAQKETIIEERTTALEQTLCGYNSIWNKNQRRN
jgi:hypothetical protein